MYSYLVVRTTIETYTLNREIHTEADIIIAGSYEEAKTIASNMWGAYGDDIVFSATKLDSKTIETIWETYREYEE